MTRSGKEKDWAEGGRCPGDPRGDSTAPLDSSTLCTHSLGPWEAVDTMTWRVHHMEDP